MNFGYAALCSAPDTKDPEHQQPKIEQQLLCTAVEQQQQYSCQGQNRATLLCVGIGRSYLFLLLGRRWSELFCSPDS